MYHYM